MRSSFDQATCSKHVRSRGTNGPITSSFELSSARPIKDHALQALTTSIIANIQAKHPNDYFLWSDGAYSCYKGFASAATLVSLGNENFHRSSKRLNTTNIATAALCGIILNLTWLLQHANPPSSVHILCVTINMLLKLAYDLANLILITSLSTLYKTLLKYTSNHSKMTRWQMTEWQNDNDKVTKWQHDKMTNFGVTKWQILKWKWQSHKVTKYF